ncbi:7768_t:CDS:2, partial [Racocetra persica]
QIWKLISSQAKETDKLLTKVAYQSSAILWLLDNLLRAIYNTKSNNDSEALQLRRQQSLKVISPNYAPPIDKDEVFEITVVNPLIIEIITILAECEEAITGHTIDHKIRKINFGVATTIEVAQEHIATQTLQQTKRSFNTSRKELGVLSKRIVT